MEDTLPPIKTVGQEAIPCLVLEENRTQFIDFETGVIGKVLTVEVLRIELDSTGDWWAYPIKDGGVFTGIGFIPKAWDKQHGTNDYSVNPPSYDSKTCVRVINKRNRQNEFFIYGSRSDLANSWNSCCGDSYTPMPGVNADGTRNFTWLIAPTVVLGDNVVNGVNVSYWGLPTLAAGYNYFPLGSFNNIAFPNASATGYASTGALLSWLNTNASSVGSPAAATLTWSFAASDAGGILIATGGDDDDVIGMRVIAVPA